MSEQAADLAEHIEQTVESIAKVHMDHYRAASPLQRGVDASTRWLGQPGSVSVLVVGMAAWMGVNGWRAASGLTTWDPPPFAMLELAGTLAALVLACLILATQRRDDRLAEQRAQLTLELALLNEQKSAKIIALLEELRRDSPTVGDRVDQESEAMARPADPEEILTALKRRGARKR